MLLHFLILQWNANKNLRLSLHLRHKNLKTTITNDIYTHIRLKTGGLKRRSLLTGHLLQVIVLPFVK